MAAIVLVSWTPARRGDGADPGGGRLKRHRDGVTPGLPDGRGADLHKPKHEGRLRLLAQRLLHQSGLAAVGYLFMLFDRG